MPHARIMTGIGSLERRRARRLHRLDPGGNGGTNTALTPNSRKRCEPDEIKRSALHSRRNLSDGVLFFKNMVFAGASMITRVRNLVVAFVVLMAGALVLPAVSTQATGIASPWRGALSWRLLGPLRGGWATMAMGVPSEPNTFYFGSADGGVWKTTDAGRTWHPLMQHQQAAAIGALAVAPSNPNILYAGTGQVAARYDIVAGDGVYRSSNAGHTWSHIGLGKTRHIGRILIDPHDPERVLVAALGNIFAPSNARGVYLTTDGGKHWQRTLFVNRNTGAVDLAWDPTRPSVVYAATWQMRMHPWLDYFQPQAGPGSGIWKSIDAGRHWRRLQGHGLPAGILGRIGLAVARGSAGKIIYATIAVARSPAGDGISSGGGSGLYRSIDGGASWKLVNITPGLASSYFGRLSVAPNHPGTVFVMGRSIRESTDAGRHFRIVKGAPGGDDYHFLWLNPRAPGHWIAAADQGSTVTVNGGKSWSSWYNQPTGQFYHIATDHRFPYWIYGGQQDSGTVAIASRGPNGIIGRREWHPVGGAERDYDVPEPGHPNLVFGSGLGGYVSRYNQATHQVVDIAPWPVSSYGANPRGVKYRYTWITPLGFGSGKAHPLYFASQVLFRSLDGGMKWQVISPDLTGKKPAASGCSNPDLPAAKLCGFGVIYTIAPSPSNPETIWIGTDDGLVQITTDGGTHWHDITPRSLPLWGRVDAIALPRSVPGTAYVAVDVHRLGASYPLIYKTTDRGRHWRKIVRGLPGDEYVLSIATDTRDPRLVFAGTNRSVYVSFSGGARWRPLGLNLPTVSVRDLLVHGNDLVAATQGRGIWSLDDIEPLREANAMAPPTRLHLFHPVAAWRLRASLNQDTPPPPSSPAGENPPTGAVIDYALGANIKGAVTLTIRDSHGKIVRRFSSVSPPPQLPVSRYFQKGWLGQAQRLSSSKGLHRFVWDLRYPRPAAIEYHYSIAAIWKRDTPVLPQGPLVLPGHYTVSLSAGGRSQTVELSVKMDPRVHVSLAALRAQLDLERKLGISLARAVAAYHQAGVELARLQREGAPARRIEALRTWRQTGSDSLAAVAGVLAALETRVEQADAAPTAGQMAVYRDYRSRLARLLARRRMPGNAEIKHGSGDPG